MSAPVNSREPRNAKKKAIENAEHQHSLETNLEEEEEDGGHLESSGSEADLEPVKPKPQGAQAFDTDELDSDSDQVDCPVMANGGDMDEESEHDEPETTAMMLADEIPSLVTDNMKPKQVVQMHRKSQSARDQKHAAEIPTWRDVDNAVSESEETTTAGSEPSEPYSNNRCSSNYLMLQEHLDAWAPTIFLLILLVSALASYPYPDLTLVILVILTFPFALYLSLQQSQYIWPDPSADESYPCSGR
ncbi:uncharacterized protein EDB93DRAFT_1244917 [Suillus bovinus]|uniref:uncharacterized protein n=1 Tax=Suillus bovinus TaxID=48563 RepID=UPI001B85C3C1|nr:uncharacterized protein EDB93DRAFT_1244917 [Suillus bovinus]KAG2160173.1 hypothetical protein EDB93DRAFT_1244917 [Suillus bovinus]